MRLQTLAAACALAVCSTAASATVVALAPGVLTPPAPNTYATFNSIVPTPYGLTTPTGTFVDAGATFSGGGIVMNNFGQPAIGLYATPLHDDTNYMAVLGGKSETIAFGSPISEFGLYWGSIDTFNTVKLYNGATLVGTVTGSQVAGLLPPPPLNPNGGQLLDNSNRYILMSGFGFFDKAVISSTANSFEFDNVVTGVPEASTWVMMGLGFGGLAFAGFSAKRKREARAIV